MDLKGFLHRAVIGHLILRIELPNTQSRTPSDRPLVVKIREVLDDYIEVESEDGTLEVVVTSAIVRMRDITKTHEWKGA